MRYNRPVYILIIILAVWLGFVTRDLYRRNNNSSQNIINQYNITGFSTDFTNIIDEADSSVVTISADGVVSSGFIYGQNNDDVLIVTTYHGVANATYINVIFASSYAQKGEIIGYDRFTDIAVVKVNTPYQMQPLKSGDANMLKKGEFVISIGTPVSTDYAAAVELGMISLKNVTVENTISIEDERYTYFLNLIELSSDLQNGYSGSPVINMNGEFVGMNTMNINSNFDFAVTANEIRIVADTLIRNEEVQRNNLGIKGSFISEMYNYEKANLNITIDTLNGIYVTKIREGSLAYEAGIRNSDIVLSINGIVINDFNDYLEALYYNEEGDFTFEYLHNGEPIVSGVKRD